MECSNPGAIRDGELFAYIEGESVRPVVLQHLANCQYCSSQATEYRRIELKLTNKLYRWDCPPNQVLGDYQFGLLNPQQAVEVGSHVRMCMLCKAEIAMLTEFLANDPMLVSQGQQVVQPAINVVRPGQEAKRSLENIRDSSLVGARRIIATLLPQQPRIAYQRDSAPQVAVWPRRYNAENVNVSIQVERKTSDRDMFQVIGFVVHQGTMLEALDGMLVKLIAHTSTVTPEYAETIDDLGNFVFSAVAEGTYTLEISFPEGIVVVDQLPVAIQ